MKLLQISCARANGIEIHVCSGYWINLPTSCEELERRSIVWEEDNEINEEVWGNKSDKFASWGDNCYLLLNKTSRKIRNEINIKNDQNKIYTKKIEIPARKYRIRW